jgi:hypothetical protein
MGRTHDPMIKKSPKPKIANPSESDKFPGINELTEFWGL